MFVESRFAVTPTTGGVYGSHSSKREGYEAPPGPLDNSEMTERVFGALRA